MYPLSAGNPELCCDGAGHAIVVWEQISENIGQVYGTQYTPGNNPTSAKITNNGGLPQLCWSNWTGAGTFGPGTSTKAVFTKESGVFLDDLLRGMSAIKVDPSSQFTVTTSPKEDMAFFVSKGRGDSLGDEQTTPKPRRHTAFPPARSRACRQRAEPVELLMYAAP